MKFRDGIVYLNKFIVGKNYKCKLNNCTYKILKRQNVRDFLGFNQFRRLDYLLVMRSDSDNDNFMWINSSFFE